MLVEDPRLADFTVKELRDLADRTTSALVSGSILTKFEKASNADSASEDFETRLFGRIKEAGAAINDQFLIHDLHMMLHLRD